MSSLQGLQFSSLFELDEDITGLLMKAMPEPIDTKCEITKKFLAPLKIELNPKIK